MAKKRVFVSFDYDHDDFLKTAIVGQSKLDDSPFELADWSIKEHLTGDWKAKARTRIKSVDIVVIMCGEHTHTAAGVNAEMEIAKDEDVTYFLLKGYANKTCTKPTSATGSDKMYDWTWPNLKLLIGGNR